MLKKLFTWIFLVCAGSLTALAALAQTSTVLHIAPDRPGDFYSIDSQKKIRKYNSEGRLITEARLDKTPTLFDPWSGVRIFTFYADSREIQYLDPSLSLKSVLLIDSAFAIEPFLACPSGEYNYWLLDKADLSLKKINPRESSVQTEVVISEYLSSPEAILYMREYLNFVFILDKEKGIIIFNQLGIKVRQLAVKTEFFGFYGEELYYLGNNKLVFYDLYSLAVKERPLTVPADKVILLQDKQVNLIGGQLKIIDFKY